MRSVAILTGLLGFCLAEVMNPLCVRLKEPSTGATTSNSASGATSTTHEINARSVEPFTMNEGPSAIKVQSSIIAGNTSMDMDMNCSPKDTIKVICIGYITIYDLEDVRSQIAVGTHKVGDMEYGYVPEKTTDGSITSTADATAGFGLRNNAAVETIVSIALALRIMPTSTTAGIIAGALGSMRITPAAMATITAGTPKLTANAKGAWIAGGVAAMAVGAVAGL